MKKKIIKVYIVISSPKQKNNGIITGLITGFVSGIAATVVFEVTKKYLGL